MRNFFLISDLNLPSFNLEPFPLVLSLQVLVKRHESASPRRWQQHLSASKPGITLGSGSIRCKLLSNTSLMRGIFNGVLGGTSVFLRMEEIQKFQRRGKREGGTIL